MMQIKKIIIFSLLISNITSIYCIKKSTAFIATGAFAGVSALASYAIWPLVKNEVHPALLAVSSIVVTSCLYSSLYERTPQGRLAQANKLINQLASHKLIQYSFSSDNAFFTAVHDVYLIHDLPLISAYNHLIQLLPMVNSTSFLIHKALSDSKSNKILREKCRCALLRTKRIFNNISHAIRRIREHKDYLAQLRIYKEFLANDKK